MSPQPYQSIFGGYSEDGDTFRGGAWTLKSRNTSMGTSEHEEYLSMLVVPIPEYHH